MKSRILYAVGYENIDGVYQDFAICEYLVDAKKILEADGNGHAKIREIQRLSDWHYKDFSNDLLCLICNKSLEFNFKDARPFNIATIHLNCLDGLINKHSV